MWNKNKNKNQYSKLVNVAVWSVHHIKTKRKALNTPFYEIITILY